VPAFILLWLVPLLMIYAQGEFFVYHYFVLTLPALVTLILWNRTRIKKEVKNEIYN
jgi:hypothetical protein